MKSEIILKDLEAVAKAHAVRVSYEALADTVGLGGLCRVKGEYRVIVDKRASTRERITTLASALNQLEVKTDTLAPKVKKLISQHGVLH